MQTITTDQAREADKAAVEKFAMPSILLMENAAMHASQIACDMLNNGRDKQPRCIVILAGGGNNGGDGYAMARQLHTRGMAVQILAMRAVDKLKGDAAINATICQRMNIPMTLIEDEGDLHESDRVMTGADLIVDALLGTGFSGEVRQPMATVIEQCNAHHGRGVKVLAVDVPSGIDADTGRPPMEGGIAIEADTTVTFVVMKAGFVHAHARKYTGRVLVRDIGLPAAMLLD